MDENNPHTMPPPSALENTAASDLSAAPCPALVEMLNEILDHQVANRGTKHAFYRCYTYGDKMAPWVKKAEKLIKQNSEVNRRT